MAAELIYLQGAADELDKLPVHIQSAALDNLERLADDPVSASNPPSSPLWPARQLFVFEIDDGLQCYMCFAVWRYNDDESSLRILAFGASKVPIRPL